LQDSRTSLRPIKFGYAVNLNIWREPLIKKLADAFRKTVSGSPEGRPSWVKSIEESEGPGLFGPDSAVWEVHGSVATLIGGIRALLLQAAHPAALAGVKTHSRYETDLLGRLQGTSKWLTILTFGTPDLIAKESARVNAMHDQVRGEYKNKSGESNQYEAKDRRFLLWVHCAFTESFLEAHLICKYPLIHGTDQYVKEWSQSAIPLGLNNAPQSRKELSDEISRFMREELAFNESTKEVVDFILHPPFGTFYAALAKTAIRSLSADERNLLHLKQPVKIWEYFARFNLWALQKALGNKSPAQQAALKRYQRMG
jgi:uncharacterized protein (DUF2236 family)